MEEPDDDVLEVCRMLNVVPTHSGKYNADGPQAAG